MLATGIFTLLFSTLVLAQSDKPDAPGYDRWSEGCLYKLNNLMAGKGVTDQPGYETFGGTCKGTRVVKERLKAVSVREEWMLYSCCRKKNGEFEHVRKLPLQNCLAFNDVGGGTLTWQKVMRLAEACKDCKVVGESQNGAPGAHLRCSCEAPRRAAKTYELPIHANMWAEGDVQGRQLSRYPCGVSTGSLECGWAWCVHNAYQHIDPPGHWHGPGSPDAND
ncbi:uncharacterized protein LY79DRAFT_518636 [Colletotrichum navitas]|uniref:Cyanovirin-N domain-containing protein n=1 Tax=Colletotrichum navitas TaxID=681940 RepID=A0AAD8V348_9PEZI|nr:uncharacterized protein LY79DRAFT_518636 [Colletotrichum navitas]KAK1585503.1 hypothetical protein LY79DRAFT_518636 [Colletotrichum navitas]